MQEWNEINSQEDIDSIFALIGKAHIQPQIACTFPLEEMSAVHALSEKGSGGKIVVLV